MRYLKTIFNKQTLLILSTLLRLIFVIFVVYYFSTLVGWFHYLLLVLRFVVFVRIINDTTNPSHKIPWLVLCLAFPIVGITCYILFSKKFVSYRQMRIYRKTIKVSKKYQQQSDKVTQSIGDNVDKNMYIYNQCAMPVHTGTEVKYLKNGETFLHSLLIDLKTAKKFIFMEYFYVKDGKMWSEIEEILKEKIAEGVEVRLMVDDIGTIGKVPKGFFRHLRKIGINVIKYNRFIPIISAIHNNRDHRKITVIDGIIGYTGGINIGDEYVNYTHPYGYWKDTAVRLYGKAVDNFTIMFLQMFNSQTKRVDMYSDYIIADTCTAQNDGFVQPFCDGPKPIFTDQIGENTYLNIINQAKHSVTITTPYFIVDYQLINALKMASSRGIDVKLVVPNIPDKKIVYALTRTNYKQLFSSGVKVYKYTPGFIHGKMILADDEVAMVGTMNWDYRSLVHHYEDGVLMYKTSCIADIKKDMDDIIEASEEQSLENTKINIFVRIWCSLIAVFSPLF